MQRAELEDLASTASPRGVVGPFELDDAFGERAGLVGAQHVHAAEVLDRVQAPHEHAVRAPSSGAARQVDAEDRRQQLGAQSDGQRDREEQRLDRRPPASMCATNTSSTMISIALVSR